MWAVMALSLGGAAVTAQPVADAVLRPPPQLRAEGMPELRRLPAAAMAANDADPPAHRLVGWHPQRAELLLLTRRGPSAQLHRLNAPRLPPQSLTQGRDAVEGARWEPSQARYLVFRRDQAGDEAWRLYRQADEGGDPVRITPAHGRVAEYRFLPDGRGLVYLHERVDRDDPDAERVAHSRLVWVDPLAPERSRTVAEVRGGRFFGLAVTGDGRVLVSRRQDQRTTRLAWKAVDRGAEPEPDPEPARQAEGPAKAAPGDPDDEPLWSIQALRGDFRHLVRTGARSGQRQALLTEQGAELDLVAAPPAGQARPLALAYNEHGLSALRLWHPREPEVAPQPLPVALPPGVIRALAWHPRRALLAIDHASAQSAGRLFVFDLERGTLEDWSGHAREPGPDGTFPSFGTLRWKSFDGEPISALHVAPPARFTGPRPVFISLHGGPAAQARPAYLSATERHLVERLGMHLVLPNVRGSTGFGRRFVELDNGRLRENAVKDVGSLLDLVAGRADMDAGAVVVAGGSYGGYLTLAVAVHESARIAGAISRVGVTHFVTFLEQTESYRRDNRRAEYGDERDPAMREFLAAISPLTRAERIRKPLFIVHGRNDPRVPYAEAEQLVAAVRANGTPVWFLTAEDEGHSFSGAENRFYLHAATLQFVQRLVEKRPLN